MRAALLNLTDKIGAVGSLRGLALFRIVVGLMVLRHIWVYIIKFFELGFYQEFFYLPYFDWLPHPPTPGSYLLLLALITAGSVGVILGYRTRAALIATFILTTYHLLLNEFWYRHNRYFMLLALFLLCFSRCGDTLSFDSARRPLSDKGPIWPAYLIRIQLTLIYLASASSKILDPDWRSGGVLLNRDTMLGWQNYAPVWLQEILPRSVMVDFATIMALLTEYFLAIALWVPPLQKIAIWVGVLFHGYIEIRYAVLTFSYLSIGCYFLVVSSNSPKGILSYCPDRFLHRVLADLIRVFDWFQKISLQTGDSLTWTGLKGKRFEGWRAILQACNYVPLTFVFAFPVSILAMIQFPGSSLERREAKQGSEFPCEPKARPLMSPRSLVLTLTMFLLVYVNVMWLKGAVNFAGMSRLALEKFDPFFLVLICSMLSALPNWNRAESASLNPKVSDGIVKSLAATTVVVLLLLNFTREFPPYIGECSESISQELMEESVDLGRNFMLRHQRQNGSFSYEYDWKTKQYSLQDSDMQQAGALWTLALLYQYQQTPELRIALQKGFTFFITNSFQRGSTRILKYPGVAQGSTATVAFVSLALIDYLSSTKEHEQQYETFLKGLLAHLFELRQPGGQWHAGYDLTNGSPLGEPLPSSDGAALLALTKAHTHLAMEDLKQIVLESVNVGFKKHVVDRLLTALDPVQTKEYFPWISLVNFELARGGHSGNRPYAERVIAMTDWMIDVHSILGRSRNTAYAFQGIIPAYSLALDLKIRSKTRKFACVIERGMSKVASFQVGHTMANSFISEGYKEDDPMALGGAQDNPVESKLRMESAQHQIHAAILALTHFYGHQETK